MAPAAPAARDGRACAPQAPAPAPPQPGGLGGERDTVVPHSNIRRRTAEHMIRSKQTSAHVYAPIEVDYEAVEQVRRAEGGSRPRRASASPTALQPGRGRRHPRVPEVNATFGENELIVHNYVNLGIAVDLDFKGLDGPGRPRRRRQAAAGDRPQVTDLPAAPAKQREP